MASYMYIFQEPEVSNKIVSNKIVSNKIDSNKIDSNKIVLVLIVGNAMLFDSNREQFTR